MKVTEAVKLLEADVLCGDAGDVEICSACGSDMMSDVLAFVKEQACLLTGLVNPQVIRTAEMMDIKCVIFVRGKKPDEDILSLARAKDIVVLRTGMSMFSACGALYSGGLRGGKPA
ncbi:MAG: hypothetical protein K5756_02920 [Clostridiales bacterium]|nr:hypothetical protein [Clostridiales bacterium]